MGLSVLETENDGLQRTAVELGVHKATRRRALPIGVSAARVALRLPDCLSPGIAPTQAASALVARN